MQFKQHPHRGAMGRCHHASEQHRIAAGRPGFDLTGAVAPLLLDDIDQHLRQSRTGEQLPDAFSAEVFETQLKQILRRRVGMHDAKLFICEQHGRGQQIEPGVGKFGRHGRRDRRGRETFAAWRGH